MILRLSSRLARASLACGLALPMACGCGGTSSGNGEAASSTTDALTALSAAEIVGSIAYGQTSASIAYTDTPRYRALQFAGKAGDPIDVFVRSPNGHARAWILASDFSNLAYGNSDGTTSDAHMTLTLPSTGTFYVAFRDAFQEDATFTVSLSGPSTPPPPPPPPPPCDPEVTNCPTGPGQIVTGADRSFSLGTNLSNAVLETWGKGLWEGYVSFVAVAAGEITLDHAVLTDASGATYPIAGVATRYARLPLPVTLRGSSDGSVLTTVTLTQLSYEVTKVNSIASQSLRGIFDGTNPRSIAVIGADIPGVTLTFNASATFFQNFTNGNACDRVTLNEKELTPRAPSSTFSVVAPLSITAAATCISSRLGAPQDPSADVAVGLSSISVGNPH